MEFEIWQIWLIGTILFFILEMVIPSFVIFNFGIGALVASIADGIGISIEWQLLLFSIGTISSFFILRPVLRKWAYNKSHKIETNVNAMIGRTGFVSETIDQQTNTGRVKLDGDDWMARTTDGSVVQKGEAVRIVNIESIVLYVERLTKG